MIAIVKRTENTDIDDATNGMIVISAMGATHETSVRGGTSGLKIGVTSVSVDGAIGTQNRCANLPTGEHRGIRHPITMRERLANHHLLQRVVPGIETPSPPTVRLLGRETHHRTSYSGTIEIPAAEPTTSPMEDAHLGVMSPPQPMGD